MGSACSEHEGSGKFYYILVGSPEWKRPLGTSRHRWKDNIKIDITRFEERGLNSFNSEYRP
jgi:hypothetical protein